MQNNQLAHPQLYTSAITTYDYIELKYTSEINPAPIFIKKDRFNILETSSFILSESLDSTNNMGWDNQAPSIVSWVKLKDKDNGHIFFVYNTHFPHNSPFARTQSAVYLLKNIRKSAGFTPTIVLGSFPGKSSEEAYQTLRNNWIGYSPLWNVITSYSIHYTKLYEVE